MTEVAQIAATFYCLPSAVTKCIQVQEVVCKAGLQLCQLVS